SVSPTSSIKSQAWRTATWCSRAASSLIRHDPEYRGVRREHLIEAGRRVRLKAGLPAFVEFLEHGVEGHQFSFYVVSAAPREVVVSALDGIVPADHIFGTELEYDPDTGEVRSMNVGKSHGPDGPPPRMKGCA